MTIYIFLILFFPIAYSLDNGLGRTPPMGWNSWNKFACKIDEDLIKQTADAMVSTGLAAAGYRYLNIDDCWQKSRDIKTGVIQADAKAFPSGMKALGDYIHSKNLKYGLYSDAGTHTCQGRPGSLYFEKIDAKTYAEWGVDYLKYDNCFNLALPAQFRYPRMRDALNETGRPIFYSICNWGQAEIWTWGEEVGNSWRTTGDITDKWKSVLNIIEKQALIANYSAPGGWNDPDMLEVGNGGMTPTEYGTHFVFWAFMKAPLIIGCDVRNMSKDTLELLTNKEVIAINQDSLGVSVVRHLKADNKQVWGGPVADGYVAILLNTGEKAIEIVADFDLFGLVGAYNVRDVLNQKDLGAFEKSFAATVAPHGVVAIKLTKAKSGESQGFLETINL